MKNGRHKLVPAAFIIFKKGNKILLSRRYNTGHEDGNYSLPSGHLEIRESYTACAVREAMEEVGVKVSAKDLQFIHTSQNYFDSPDVNDHYINVFFLCTKWKGEIKNAEPHKCDELRWVEINKLPRNTIDYVKDVLKCVTEKKYFSELKK